jgi:thiamine-monophosphate kinase
MKLTEFSIIDTFFTKQKVKRSDVFVGIGDDCAITKVPKNYRLVTTVDTMVAGMHFLNDTPAAAIGHKIAAVSLSDLAAMGAIPAWATLAITLPKANSKWLKQFCQGLFTILKKYNVQLIGGNTTAGPLTITSQISGFVPNKKALLRSSAKIGDLIYVTGTLGDAGLALQLLHKQKSLNTKDKKFLIQRLQYPEPRVKEGQQLLKIAHAAIDISDGLAADLSHILYNSNVGATLFIEDLPLSAALKNNTSPFTAWKFALTSGDDYELCITIPPHLKSAVTKFNNKFSCGLKQIGIIEKKPGLRLQLQDKTFSLTKLGYEHFSR